MVAVVVVIVIICSSRRSSSSRRGGGGRGGGGGGGGAQQLSIVVMVSVQVFPSPWHVVFVGSRGFWHENGAGIDQSCARLCGDCGSCRVKFHVGGFRQKEPHPAF